MKRFCPVCQKEREVKPVRSVQVRVRGEEFRVPVEMFGCPACGEVFDTPENPQDELDKAYRLYREKHGLMQPEEIRALREKLGLSQAELAEIIGCSVATLERYEQGALQDPAHDWALRRLREATS